MPNYPSAVSVRSLGLIGLILTLGMVSRPCAADPVFGFREDWFGTSVNGWSGGGASGVVLSNPGTGGTFGTGDGYLLLQLTDPGQFGTRSTGVEYSGNWLLAGIEQVKIALNDVGAPDALEIHFCIGNSSNFWEAKYGFVPTNGMIAPLLLTQSAANSLARSISCRRSCGVSGVMSVPVKKWS